MYLTYRISSNNNCILMIKIHFEDFEDDLHWYYIYYEKGNSEWILEPSKIATNFHFDGRILHPYFRYKGHDFLV